MKIEHKKKDEYPREKFGMLCDGDIFSPKSEPDNLFIKTDEGDAVRLSTGVATSEFEAGEVVNNRTDDYKLVHVSLLGVENE